MLKLLSPLLLVVTMMPHVSPLTSGTVISRGEDATAAVDDRTLEQTAEKPNDAENQILPQPQMLFKFFLSFLDVSLVEKYYHC